MDPILAAAIAKLRSAPDSTDAETFLRGETGGKYGFDDARKYLATVTQPTSGHAGVLSSIGRTLAGLATGTPSATAGELTDPNSGIRNVLRSASQGATANFSDELLGLLPSWLGGGPGAEEDMRQRNAAFQRDNPVASGVANVAGAGAGLLALPELKAATLLGGITKGALMGAGMTSLAGAGAGTDAQSRITNATDPRSLAFGAMLGAFIPATIGGGKYVAGRFGGGSSRLATAIEQSGGPAAVKAKAIEFGQAGLGDVATLGDLSDPLRAASKYAVQNSEEAAMPRIRATQARNAATPQRFLDKLREMTPEFGADPNAPAAQSALDASTAQWANGPKGYGGLRTNNPRVANTVIAPRRGSPAFQQAMETLNAARRLGVGGRALQHLQDAADAVAPPPLNPTEAAFGSVLKQPVVRMALQRAKTAGYIGETPEPGSVPSFEKMMQLKLDVQDAADRAITAGGGKSQLGFNLKEAANLIDQHLAEHVPDYANVRAEYHTRMGLSRAFDTGKELFQTGDSRQISDAIANMSPDELHNARLSMASEMVAKLRNPTQAQSFSRQLMNAAAEGSSESALQEKIQAMFGDRARFDAYMQFAKLNHELGRMSGAYSGSDTYRNFMSGTTDPIESGLSIGAHSSVGGVKRAMLREASQAAIRQLRRAGAANMAGPLMTTGPANIATTIDQILSTHPLFVGRTASQIGPGMIGGLLSQQRNP
jgi:hypothetical protein